MGITNIEITKIKSNQFQLMVSYNNGQKVTKIQLTEGQLRVLAIESQRTLDKEDIEE